MLGIGPCYGSLTCKFLPNIFLHSLQTKVRLLFTSNVAKTCYLSTQLQKFYLIEDGLEFLGAEVTNLLQS